MNVARDIEAFDLDGWTVTDFLHPDCLRCLDCATAAISSAQLSGSLGAGWSVTISGRVRHHASVRRPETSFYFARVLDQMGVDRIRSVGQHASSIVVPPEEVGTIDIDLDALEALADAPVPGATRGTIEGIVRRTVFSSASGCHGSESLEIDGMAGRPSLPLDWMAGEMVPDGARVRITVEVLDRAEDMVPTNWWHQHRYRDRWCVCQLDPDRGSIPLSELPEAKGH